MSQDLRKGWTTGACATAAARAAYVGLLTGRVPETVVIALPHDRAPTFAIHRGTVTEAPGSGPVAVLASVIKDAGDDPDVTHGAEIIARVAWGPPGSGVTFRAGEGVGTVTRPGLPLAVGEPAINPAPRQMILSNLQAAGRDRAGTGAGVGANRDSPGANRDSPIDVVVTIGVANGAALAERTLNGRLGIVGGLSILGTTGVVVPYSCSAWVASIHRGIDVARASGLDHLAASTGRTSERAVQALYGLPDAALIDMGDFAGAVLKYLRQRPVPRLTLAGGVAKLAKLAQGAMDLHSGRSRVDMARLAALTADAGGDPILQAAVAAADGAAQALDLTRAAGLDLAAPIARHAQTMARAVVGEGIAVDVVIFDRTGGLLAHTKDLGPLRLEG